MQQNHRALFCSSVPSPPPVGGGGGEGFSDVSTAAHSSTEQAACLLILTGLHGCLGSPRGVRTGSRTEACAHFERRRLGAEGEAQETLSHQPNSALQWISSEEHLEAPGHRLEVTRVVENCATIPSVPPCTSRRIVVSGQFVCLLRSRQPAGL
ncbi:hypothetical protein Q5P01_015528 [Channa striata]|uniref:Uncharacterized protein n=1 Tax=Channa striata TaxID=64152 RepID=A0AA88SD57_CHASR|nr:hypothetical protein Q5P01_015528 [Channa striata]